MNMADVSPHLVVVHGNLFGTPVFHLKSWLRISKSILSQDPDSRLAGKD